MKNTITERILHALLVEFAGDISRLTDDNLNEGWDSFRNYYSSVRQSIEDNKIFCNV